MAWMATVGIVVFVALVVEIITTTHTVRVGDVVTDHPNCSQIGIEILQDGGNAVDAAVAAGLCLTVTTPSRAGLGGGGVMLVHQLRNNKTVVIDFQVNDFTLNIQMSPYLIHRRNPLRDSRYKSIKIIRA